SFGGKPVASAGRATGRPVPWEPADQGPDPAVSPFSGSFSSLPLAAGRQRCIPPSRGQLDAAKLRERKRRPGSRRTASSPPAGPARGLLQDHQDDAAVLGATLAAAAVGHRSGLAVGDRLHAEERNPLLGEVLLDGRGALRAELLVVGLA